MTFLHERAVSHAQVTLSVRSRSNFLCQCCFHLWPATGSVMLSSTSCVKLQIFFASQVSNHFTHTSSCSGFLQSNSGEGKVYFGLVCVFQKLLNYRYEIIPVTQARGGNYHTFLVLGFLHRQPKPSWEPDWKEKDIENLQYCRDGEGLRYAQFNKNRQIKTLVQVFVIGFNIWLFSHP